MANKKYESIYQNTINFIYKSTVKRLNDKRDSLKKKTSDLIVDNSGTQYDLSMVSKILNNKRTSNNPYLIPPAYTELLAHQLEVDSVGELLWGKSVDYADDILSMLIKEVLDKHPEHNKRLTQALLENVQYAKYSAVNNYSWYYDKLDTELGDSVEDSLEEMQRFAIGKFCCLYGFDYIFLDHLIKNEGLSKLDKCIDAFVDDILISLLSNISSDDTSFGRQAYNLLVGCESQINRFTEHYVSVTIDKEADASAYYDTSDIPDRLKDECYSYVNLLEDAQNEMYDNLNVDLPDKKNIYQAYMKIVKERSKNPNDKISFIDEIEKCID